MDCECISRLHVDSEGSLISDEIIFCPLHKAAPELLEALKECLEIVESHYGTGTIEGDDAVIAISKAEGKQEVK